MTLPIIIIISIPLCLLLSFRVWKKCISSFGILPQKGDFDPAIDEEEFERVSKKFGWDERATRLR
jgi:hypothetical protein